MYKELVAIVSNQRQAGITYAITNSGALRGQSRHIQVLQRYSGCIALVQDLFELALISDTSTRQFSCLQTSALFKRVQVTNGKNIPYPTDVYISSLYPTIRMFVHVCSIGGKKGDRNGERNG